MLGYGLLQWIGAVIAAFGIGLSKTGLSALGILAVAVFALAFPGTDSPGIVLPILISADIVAVASYRKFADWSHLWGLYPWTALGVVLGALLMSHLANVPRALKEVSNNEVSHLIGAILIVLIVVQAVRKMQTKRAGKSVDPPRSRIFAGVMGLMAGFTTMVANAAGPIMILYLLASGLPTMQFMGTGAWFFFSVNLFKVPFSVHSKMMSAHTVLADIPLIPFSILGAFFGKPILARINQDTFENVSLALTLVAGLKLLLAH